MKEYTKRHLRKILSVALSALFTIICKPAMAEVCKLGHLNVEASPMYIGFDVTNPNMCHQNKLLRLRITGEASAFIDQIRLEPDANSRFAFKVININTYTDLQPTETGEWGIDFKIAKPGEYSTDIVVTYGRGSLELGRFRTCITSKYERDIQSRAKVIEDLERKGPDMTVINLRITEAKRDQVEAEKRLQTEKSAAQLRVTELVAEKEKVLEEYRKGFFCSTCGKSKSEFEKRGDDFDQHIREGASEGRYARAAKPEEIEKKKKEYDDKIQSAQEAVNRVIDKINETYTQLKQRLDQIDKQRLIIVEAFNRKIEELKEARKRVQTTYAEAMQDFEERRTERKMITISAQGVCRAK